MVRRLTNGFSRHVFRASCPRALTRQYPPTPAEKSRFRHAFPDEARSFLPSDCFFDFQFSQYGSSPIVSTR